MDYSRLRGKIVEKFGTIYAFAKALDTDANNVYIPLKKGKPLRGVTIEKWASLLGISNKDIGAYFFTPEVEKTQH